METGGPSRKKSRVPFTRDEQDELASFLAKCPSGRDGRLLFQQFSATHAAHTWQSWRAHFLSNRELMERLIRKKEHALKAGSSDQRQEKKEKCATDVEGDRRRRTHTASPQPTLGPCSNATITMSLDEECQFAEFLRQYDDDDMQLSLSPFEAYQQLAPTHSASQYRQYYISHRERLTALEKSHGFNSDPLSTLAPSNDAALPPSDWGLGRDFFSRNGLFTTSPPTQQVTVPQEAKCVISPSFSNENIPSPCYSISISDGSSDDETDFEHLFERSGANMARKCSFSGLPKDFPSPSVVQDVQDQLEISPQGSTGLITESVVSTFLNNTRVTSSSTASLTSTVDQAISASNPPAPSSINDPPAEEISLSVRLDGPNGDVTGYPTQVPNLSSSKLASLHSHEPFDSCANIQRSKSGITSRTSSSFRPARDPVSVDEAIELVALFLLEFGSQYSPMDALMLFKQCGNWTLMFEVATLRRLNQGDPTYSEKVRSMIWTEEEDQILLAFDSCSKKTNDTESDQLRRRFDELEYSKGKQALVNRRNFLEALYQNKDK